MNTDAQNTNGYNFHAKVEDQFQNVNNDEESYQMEFTLIDRIQAIARLHSKKVTRPAHHRQESISEEAIKDDIQIYVNLETLLIDMRLSQNLEVVGLETCV